MVLFPLLGDKFYGDYLSEMTKRFDVEEGPLEEHLGILYSFDWERRICTMTMSTQIGKVLQIFGFEHCKPAAAPSMDGPDPCEADCETSYDGDWDMEGFVGHMTWIFTALRADIGKPVKVLSRFTKRFGKRHVEYAKHLLRYLKGTRNKGLVYTAEFPLYYQIFTDASHAGCVDTRRSITSLVVKLGGNTVYWKVMFTSIVSHSSCESELMALDVGATIGQFVPRGAI